MAPSKTAKPSFGLVLSLGGAPATPHTIPGLDGYFSPDQPRSLQDCGLSLEEAKAYDADPGFPLSLVELNGKDGQ